MKHVFCFGFGYSAAHLAARMAPYGWKFSGTVRSAEKVAALTAQGVDGYAFDGLTYSADIEDALATASHILLSIPPGADGDPALAVFGKAIENSPSITWIGYFSTIGVYGDTRGGWVDETTTVAPPNVRGARRLNAETAWLELAARCGKAALVLRLPGIYGPGRSVVDDLKSGTLRLSINPGHVFNRIHVEDIAGASEAAINYRGHHRVFNIADDLPATREDVIGYAAELLGLPVPNQSAGPPPSEMARSFYDAEKRVSNARMKAELGVRLIYPTYKEGLKAIAGSNSGS